MDYDIENFSNALDILRPRRAFAELIDVLNDLDREAIVEAQLDLGRTLAGGPPRGGQKAVNLLLRERLRRGHWRREVELFAAAPNLRKRCVPYCRSHC